MNILMVFVLRVIETTTNIYMKRIDESILFLAYFFRENVYMYKKSEPVIGSLFENFYLISWIDLT